ncbi:hypothetical protein BKA56DRAFT_270979 [Ilyonectria sp. MPI-CAGE-AT-0026]|nr:hypothetical protein BKA56DRAFT_270979 [Ilyonectria sp. MPI-CAGE-AT-0026]
MQPSDPPTPRRRQSTQQQVSKASSMSSRFAPFAPRLTCPICELLRCWTNYRHCHIHSNVPMLTVGAGMSTKWTSAQELRVPAAGPGVSRPPWKLAYRVPHSVPSTRTRGWTKPNASAWRVSCLTHLAIGCLLAGSRPVEDAGPLLKCPDRPLDQTPYRGCPTAPPAASLPPLAVQRAASQMIFSFPVQLVTYHRRPSSLMPRAFISTNMQCSQHCPSLVHRAATD